MFGLTWTTIAATLNEYGDGRPEQTIKVIQAKMMSCWILEYNWNNVHTLR